MASINKIKVAGNDYNIAVGQTVFSYPIGDDKGWGKCFTIYGFGFNWSNRQFEFMLRGRHCPNLFVMVKYQNDGQNTLNSCNFTITAVSGNNEDTHVVFSKEIVGEGAQLHIWCKFWDFNTITLINPPEEMEVYNYQTTEYKSSETAIPNQITVKYIFDTTKLVAVSPFSNGEIIEANQPITIQYNKGIVVFPLDVSGTIVTLWGGTVRTIHTWTSFFNTTQHDVIKPGTGLVTTHDLYKRYKIMVNGSSVAKDVEIASMVQGIGVDLVNDSLTIKANKSVWVAYL